MAEQNQNAGSTGYFFAGVLVGGLAGAAVSLLMAPQSGKETRNLIQQKGIELRDQATEGVESIGDMAKQVGVKANQITADLRLKAEELQKQALNATSGQLDKFTTLVEGA
jgi:gas vesicle protein